MKGNVGIKFYTVVILTAVFALISLYGFTVPGFGWRIPGASEIITGIDIRGGVHTILYPAKTDGAVTQDELDTAKQIIINRLDNKNILDRTVTTDNVEKRIIVDIPWGKGESEFNPQATIKELGETTLLSFQEVDENLKDAKGKYMPTGKIIISGTDVVDAQPEPNPEGGMQVTLVLSKDAAVKFEEATGRLINKPIAIFMDDRYISAPVVSSKISGGNAVITLGTGNKKDQVIEAKELASTIRAGALPFKLVPKQINSISPTLGENALKVTINAGIVAFILIFFFMLFYYRLPGIIANVALVAHTALLLLAFSWLGLTLTLPGIAGIILSIGMAVDANVIIFERIKDELRIGRTLRAGIDVGFQKAFSAVLDANVTTLISAVVLLYFGTGPLKSFALTLLLGVILSFLTAVTASRIMLKAVADVDIAKKRWLYGVKEG